MSPRRSRQAPMSEMNVVPYIDVMLVLLVIFMITAPMLTQGVDVDLPSTDAKPLPVDAENEPLIISVDANGGYFLEVGEDRSNPKSLQKIVSEVSSILAERPEANVYVRGDEHVRYGTVIRLMSSLQRAGASEVGLITDPPEEE
ncbi:protein TolR [Salicola sp. Rm-C-2C1-2]|uniref:protein TolR n=1 Tax=Salicola sp. Rm-C-2C1-2 TaxID=3141321 RepID=UPI0032E4F622